MTRATNTKGVSVSSPRRVIANIGEYFVGIDLQIRKRDLAREGLPCF